MTALFVAADTFVAPNRVLCCVLYLPLAPWLALHNQAEKRVSFKCTSLGESACACCGC